MRKILYLHGFNSSPSSMKASSLKAYLEGKGMGGAYRCPELPHRPAEAMRVMESLVEGAHADELTLIGSSLGGFYATHLTEKYGFKSVLVNPGVFAHASLKPYIGPQTNLYTGAKYEFTQQHVDELAALAHPRPNRLDRYWLLVETGDETLDYREAVQFYRGARQLVIQGGDHGFQAWTRLQPAVVEWAGLR
jgi:uncharacterized protein